MLLSVLSCYKNSIKKLTTQNNLRLISNVPFDQPYTSYNYKDNFLFKKFNDINEWYIKFTGLDEVKRLQDKVIITQERLEKVQEERREKGKIIVDIRKDSTIIQEQLHQVKKWENVQKFVDLTQKEAELMKQEKELTAQFEVLDKEERELFSTLCNTIRDSHEKEKSQSEYTKYWGIILSIIGTIVGAVISTIISTIRNRQIVIGINKNVEEKFNEISSMYKPSNSNENYEKNIQLLRDENREFFKEILTSLSIYTIETKNYINVIKNFHNEFFKFNNVLRDMSNLSNIESRRNLLQIDQKSIYVDETLGAKIKEVGIVALLGASIMILLCGCCR